MNSEPIACLHCREPLRPGATRCPACSSWQTRWGADSRNLRLELAVVGVAFLLLTVLGLVWVTAAPKPSPSPSRSDYAASLTVEGAAIVSRQRDDSQALAVRATVHNHAAVGLRDLSVVVRLHDHGGRVLEEFSGRDYQVVVPAGGSAPLLVATSWSTTDPDAVATIAVEVRRAEVAD